MLTLVLGLDFSKRILNSSANFRASRTVKGSGDHPAARPSSTTGGASCELAKTWAGLSA